MRKLTLALLSLFFLFGCQKINEETQANLEKSAEQSPKQLKQEIFVHGRDDPETLSPHKATGVVESNIIVNIFEGLTRYHPKTMVALPGVAKSWTISPNADEYIFKLRKDAKWSDGTPITAQTFVYSWRRIVDPATASRYVFQLFLVENAEQINSGKIKDLSKLGVEALDPYTLRVKLKSPAPYFPTLTSHYTYAPVPEHIIQKHGDRWILPANVVTNGAFLLKSWEIQKEILMEKNPLYWDAANVKLEKVTFLPAPDYETAFKLYEAGRLHTAFEVPPIKVRQLKGRSDFYSQTYLNSMYYWFNTERVPLNDPRVRKAIALAIDRKVITDNVLQRDDVPSTTMTPPKIANYESPDKIIEFNVEKAKALLKEAGFGPEGKPFPTLELLYNTTDEHRTVAEVVQGMLKRNLDINLTLRNEEWKSYLKSMEARDFDVCRAGWIGDYVDPNTFLELLVSNNPQNYGKYSNPAYDQLIEKAAHELDQKKRAVTLNEAEKLALSEPPILPLYSQSKGMLLKPFVKGYYPNILDTHPLQDVYIDFAAKEAYAKNGNK